MLRLDWHHLLRENFSLATSIFERRGESPETAGRITLSWFESTKAPSLSAFRDTSIAATDLHIERPLKDDPQDGMFRANLVSDFKSGQEVDVRGALQNAFGRIRAHSTTTRTPQGKGSEGIIGADTSVRWDSSGVRIQPPSP